MGNAKDGSKTGAVPLLLGLLCLEYMGLGALMPLLPSLVIHFSADAATAGLLVSAYAFAIAAAAPILGPLSDRFGRTPILAASAWISAFSSILLALSGTLLMLFAARAVAGLAAGNGGVIQAMAADLSEPQRRTRTVLMVNASFGVGLIFGPAYGGFCVVVGGEESSLFVLGATHAALMTLVAIAIPRFLPSRPRRIGTDAQPASMKPSPGPAVDLKLPFRSKSGLLLALFLTAASQSGLVTIYGFWVLERFNWQELELAALLAGVGLAVLLFNALLLPRLSDSASDRSLFWILSGLALASLAAVLTWGTALIAIVSACVLMASYTGLSSVLNSTLTRLFPSQILGKGMGAALSIATIGRIIGPIAIGSCYSFVGPATTFAALMVIALGLGVASLMTLWAKTV